jgi:hypothetical protein
VAIVDTGYETDFYSWAMTQSALLRAGKLADADIENIAEEIESMGRSEKRELVNRLSVLLMHLLKWQAQSAGRCTSWRLTIEEQRSRLVSHLADNPSLKSSLPASVADGHRLARLGAARETGLELASFPADCPWTYAQITDPDFWPT